MYAYNIYIYNMCVYNAFNPKDGLLLKPINIPVEQTLFQV